MMIRCGIASQRVDDVECVWLAHDDNPDSVRTHACCRVLTRGRGAYINFVTVPAGCGYGTRASVRVISASRGSERLVKSPYHLVNLKARHGTAKVDGLTNITIAAWWLKRS